MKALQVFYRHGWSEMLLVLWGDQIRNWCHQYAQQSYARGYRDGAAAHVMTRLAIENRFAEPNPEEHLLH